MTAGRPRKEIDFDKLEKLCILQCTATECASFFEVSVDTLDLRIKDAGYKNFTDYYKRYADQGKISLRRWQYRSAESGNVTMLIWLGKQYLGQTDKSEKLNKFDTSAHTVLTDLLSKINEDDGK
jgi:hypothetical protein